ncbi:unnamed protein product, partial [Rodentolepis nana]|uniref:ATP-dependent RNA helicase n=1 Tax=Rodentolepis nana TaxID=102285 RepID=A0A0R3TV64_RODNA
SNLNKSCAKISPKRINVIRNPKGVQGFGITRKPAINGKNKTYFVRKNGNVNGLAYHTAKEMIKDVGLPANAYENVAENVSFSGDSNKKVINEKQSPGSNLKFLEKPIQSNPLQVGLSSKRHLSQQDLLSAIGETVQPNIESVFSESSWNSFGSDVHIHPHLLAAIQNRFKFKHPTSIQVASIKNLMEGRDALIKAQTGSGKTIAYVLPMLNDLMTAEPPITRQSGPKCVIILPTRELATQTFTVLTQICGACVRIVPGCLVGGAKRKNEKASIRKGLNIIVTTPRRLLDHLSKTSTLHLGSLKWFVIDEADRLVELGFERDVRRIIEIIVRETTPKGGKSSIQTVLLSATLSPGVENLAGLALRNPVKCEVSENQTGNGVKDKVKSEDKQTAQFSLPSGLKHFLLVVPCKQRLVALAAFLLLKAKYNSKSGKLIVFFATQDCVDFHHRLFSETLRSDSDSGQDEFRTNDLNFYRLHGNMDPKERYSVFQAFSGCPNGILFTTDVASRGLDLAGVAWVVQYHVSGTPIDYVHRVGRTARCGGRGKALLFLQSEEKSFIQLLASTVGVEFKPVNLTDLLQTALYHLQNTKKKAGINTVEEAASIMSRYFLQTVYEEGSELKLMAERAYTSFIRAYASFSGEMRLHFTFHRLHLGHVARAFCLNEAPSQISRGRTTKKRGDEFTIEGSAIRSRRLKLDETDEGSSEYQPSKKKQKVNPSKLAEINMLAEYGL